jgi:hypothetical protein
MVDTSSEQYRHECEVRYVANLPHDAARNAYLVGVKQKRGIEAWKKLRADTWALLNRSHRLTAT